jgi:RNA polymerase sigma factor (sigma-70 family)
MAKGGMIMNPVSHEEHIRHSFDSYCKKVLKNEARNAYSQEKRQRKREVSFAELSARELEQLTYYPTENFNFEVTGYDVVLEDEALAAAIAALPNEKRDVILLSYFLDMNDREIGEKLNLLSRTVQRRRVHSLRELKRFLEEYEYE